MRSMRAAAPVLAKGEFLLLAGKKQIDFGISQPWTGVFEGIERLLLFATAIEIPKAPY